jgi:hypothetical protein
MSISSVMVWKSSAASPTAPVVMMAGGIVARKEALVAA